MPAAVDYNAFLVDQSPEAVRQFRLAHKGLPAFQTDLSAWAAVLSAGVLIAMLFIFGIPWTIAIAMGARSGQSAIPTIFLVMSGLVWIGVLAAAIAATRKALLATLNRWRNWAKLDAFAKANGMMFSPREPDPNYPGMIFQLGTGRLAIDHLRSSAGRYFDYGNFRYTIGSGKNRTTRNWGFIALHLDRAMPHMLLDAKSNNSLFGASNLPAEFQHSQILSLEGDFDKHFTLYCPTGYERDALYVFNPNLMAQLVDTATTFDVEIIDQWLFAYSAKPFDMTHPATHARVWALVEAAGTAAVKANQMYADERIGTFAANIVAPAGSALKRRASIAGVAVLTVFLAVWAWSFLNIFFKGLG